MTDAEHVDEGPVEAHIQHSTGERVVVLTDADGLDDAQVSGRWVRSSAFVEAQP